MSVNDRCQVRVIHEERVSGAKREALGKGEIHDLSLFFKALADPTRLKIMLALAGGEMCVCDLAACLTVSESAVSHQLRFLRQLQLVVNRREGPILYYRISDEHVRRVIDTALEHVRE
ncbi:MAG: ArsR/SmtB family transcription factor [Thermodesulfobacteriota bacterium]